MPSVFAPTVILLALLLQIFARAPSAEGANILFYFGMGGLSHVGSLWPVIHQLAERGHNVTVLSALPPKSSHPKVHVVRSQEWFKIFTEGWDEGGDFLGDRFAGRQHDIMDLVIQKTIAMCSALFDSPSTRSLVFDTKFDLLVVVDTSFSDCALGLAYHQYKCPFIQYSAVSVWTSYFDDFGLPIESSSYPDMQGGIHDRTPLSFYERLVATWQPINWLYRRKTEYFPALSKILQDKLHLNESPNFQEIHTKTSLVLLNTHYSNDFPRSLPPLFVPIGGIGIQEERKPLPAELEKFITKPGTKGFIYVSFGSAVQISKSNEALRRKLFATFGNMSDYQFVWKWEEDIPSEAPSNIYFANWMPQQDLLAHKNIKGYVAHGGQNSVSEAVHFGVPMAIFPVLGDQDFNANTMAAKDLAIVLEITDFTQHELTDSLNTILSDKELRARVARASQISRDRPLKPLETALWWIEFVLRHGDTAGFLMPLSARQPWWRRRLLDVWGFVFVISTVALLVISFVAMKLLSLVTFLLRPTKPVRGSSSKLKAN